MNTFPDGTYGGCGVDGCLDCFPLFDASGEQITDNFGNPLGDAPCCPDPDCGGNPCTFPGYVEMN